MAVAADLCQGKLNWTCYIAHSQEPGTMNPDRAYLKILLCLSKLKRICIKWWLSSGGVFSEQTGHDEVKMVSLEPQSIPGGHLDIDI